MIAIIFGVSGQDGIYLTKICESKGIKVVGVSRSPGEWTRGDVTDHVFVENLIKEIRPDYIFHLAAVSTTRHIAIFENHNIISSGTLYILEAAYKFAPNARVFITGSGLQFKNNGKAISEKESFSANSAYALSRIQSAFAARYYRTLGLNTFIGYLFHHESPYRGDGHISKIITNAVKRIANGSNEILEIGDINVEKEWAFAGDIAQGIFDLTTQDNVFEACIGTGKPYSIKDWLEICFLSKGLDWKSNVTIKENFKSEYSFFISDPSTIMSLGWQPKVSFEGLAKLMMENDFN